MKKALRNAMVASSLFAVSAGYGQTRAEIDRMYGAREYESALKASAAIMQYHPDDPYPYAMSGLVFLSQSKYDTAISLFKKAIVLDNDSTYHGGWSHIYIGVAYVNTNQVQKGIDELKRGLRLGFTSNAIRYAKHVLDSLGVDYERTYPKGYLPEWVTIEQKNIIYKFQDTTGITNAVYKFMANRERAYDTLFALFQPALPKKITMFVWEDADIAKTLLHRAPNFNDAKGGFAHLTRASSRGYAIASLLEYWSWGQANTAYARFIGKGVYTCFNLDGYDKLADARRTIERNHIRSVMQVWEKEDKYDDDVLYPVAGAFVYYLYHNTPPEQFRKAVKVQKLEEVKAVYGNDFDKIVTDFNHLMGIKG